ncbi:hypothetical protein GA0061103_3976 [Rhizobium multihospitium]|uniref:Uncharacterized protein n=1 Tax=Rhizobium multihospitium TaxID=410764 RepID=A0A1C3VLC8_9HYPH|nr:hypothetical protein GA0061103_3976 [Rhizobium multihospitium]
MSIYELRPILRSIPMRAIIGTNPQLLFVIRNHQEKGQFPNQRRTGLFVYMVNRLRASTRLRFETAFGFIALGTE